MVSSEDGSIGVITPPRVLMRRGECTIAQLCVTQSMTVVLFSVSETIGAMDSDAGAAESPEEQVCVPEIQ